MNVYNWDTPTTKYPDLINIKSVKHVSTFSNVKFYKYLFTLLLAIIVIIIILSYYNGF
jgi:hypothetical protein